MKHGIMIWDIDGVLIYVGDSYRQTIIETVQYYFTECIGLKLDRKLMDWKNTQDFKLAGGFNDDWELTYAAILCYLTNLTSKIDLSGMDLSTKPRDLDAMLQRLKKLGSINKALPDPDLKSITEEIKKQGGGFKATTKTLKEIYGNLGNAMEFFHKELIKRIFQEIYLGEKLFQGKYREKRRFISGEGFISREKPLVDPETLHRLREKYYFGVVTGRERFEAEHSLRKHFKDIFEVDLMMAREDTKEKKPSPQPLFECKKKICAKYSLPEDLRAFYTGDSIDDLKAAENAGFQFIAFIGGIKNKREKNIMRKQFQDMSYGLIIRDARELFEVT